MNNQISNGSHTFITGLRDGVDTLLAAYVLDCRRAMPEKNIKLHVVLAYKRQYRNAIDKLLIILKADLVEYVGDKKSKSSDAQQEQRMVDLSSRMLAVFFNPMQESVYAYAVSKGITVMLHNPQDLLAAKSFFEGDHPNP